MAEPAPARTLYVFLDESGNLDFGGKGTDHFIMSAVYTDDPNVSAAAMQSLKYDLLAARSPQIEFHASTNSHGTRERVIEAIQSLGSVIRVHTIYIDKHYAHPSLHSDVLVMSLFGSAIAKWIAKAVAGGYDQVCLVFDSVLTRGQQGAFNAKVKPALKSLGVRFHIAFHPAKSDLNGQIADYYSWAWFRWLEHGDGSWKEKLDGPGWSQFDLFRNGHTRYW